jgi:phosphatidylinositol glycan class Q protein
VLAFLNHFPLFALMVRVKDPRRLPGAHLPPVSPWRALTLELGGIAFAVDGDELALVNQPIAFSAIFFQYCACGTALVGLAD